MTPEYNEIIDRLEQKDADLTFINLRLKNLTPEESQTIFQLLEENTSVTQLQFLGNNSSGDAAIALGLMLKKNKTIKQLELGTNELDNEDIAHIVSGLVENTSVTIVDFNSNLFNNAGPIADLLEYNQSLREIDLTNSNISNAGFLDIYAALLRNRNSSLVTFDVLFPEIAEHRQII